MSRKSVILDLGNRIFIYVTISTLPFSQKETMDSINRQEMEAFIGLLLLLGVFVRNIEMSMNYGLCEMASTRVERL